MALLQSRSPRGFFKWDAVSSFVRATDSVEAARVREKLGEATITVVDPAAFVRTESVSMGSGHHTLPMLAPQVMKDPAYRPVRQIMTRFMGRRLLVSSGAESLYSLLKTPIYDEYLAFPMDKSALHSRDLDPLRLVERMPNLNKLSRVAIQATALMGHEHDPSFFEEVATSLRPHRFWDEGRYNQVRLEALARRSMVFDRGHESETEFVVRLREAAVNRIDQFTPYRTGLIGRPMRGEVRMDVTATTVELQVADVAAGWAKHVLQERGTLELCRQFRLVIYNGITLSRERAMKLDDERRFGQRTIARL